MECIKINTTYLYKLYSELAVEGRHLSLNAQFAFFYRKGYYLIMSSTVTHTIKDIQVLHHHVAIEAYVKHLQT